VLKVRDLGVAMSDRRAVKVLKLVAASAVLCGRSAANPTDLWVLRHVWDREEQIAPLTALVAGILEPHAGEPDAHPQATSPGRVDGEELARQIEAAEAESKAGTIGLAAVARLRERVADLADRAAWVTDEAARTHLLGRTEQLLRRLG
jgi:MoxR-like ATPase